MRQWLVSNVMHIQYDCSTLFWYKYMVEICIEMYVSKCIRKRKTEIFFMYVLKLKVKYGLTISLFFSLVYWALVCTDMNISTSLTLSLVLNQSSLCLHCKVFLFKSWQFWQSIQVVESKLYIAVDFSESKYVSS